MPKVATRVARKDYPENGIKKGDTYYFTALKLQRGGQIKRSLTPFKPSQLTNSSFKSGWMATQEAWAESGQEAEDMRSAAETIRDLGSDAQSSFEAMPEGLQQGETGQQLENRSSTAEDVAGQLDELADELEALEEPDDEALETIEDEIKRDDACADFESEKERIVGEADNLISDMPE